MPYDVETNGFYEDVVEWLQENVGDLLWSRPAVEWKGRGWTMNSYGYDGTREKGFRYVVRIDDPKLAMLATLRWSS